MDKTKFSLSLILAFSLLLIQVGGASAAPAFQGSSTLVGIVQSITLETDSTTGVTTVVVDLIDDNQSLQRVRVSRETAITLGLVVLNGDGKPGINNLSLGLPVDIEPKHVIPVEAETEHPVGSALATFFSDIAGLDYETIMTAHEQGIGFGVIAQALWLTTKLEGNWQIFEALLNAKQTGDYRDFTLDGSTPQNWGQLRKAILDKDKKNSVGVVMSNSDASGNGQGNNEDNDNPGHGNGNNANNGNNDANGNNKDKNKDKNK